MEDLYNQLVKLIDPVPGEAPIDAIRRFRVEIFALRGALVDARKDRDRAAETASHARDQIDDITIELKELKMNHRQLQIQYLTKELLDVFLRAAQKRTQFNKFDKENNTWEWVLYERMSLLDRVNEFRRSNKLQEVGVDNIINAEKKAIGHTDYASKLALYCAEVAVLS